MSCRQLEAPCSYPKPELALPLRFRHFLATEEYFLDEFVKFVHLEPVQQMVERQADHLLPLSIQVWFSIKDSMPWNPSLDAGSLAARSFAHFSDRDACNLEPASPNLDNHNRLQEDGHNDLITNQFQQSLPMDPRQVVEKRVWIVVFNGEGTTQSSTGAFTAPSVSKTHEIGSVRVEAGGLEMDGDA